MKDERSASPFGASPRITPEAQAPAPEERIASPEKESEAATRAGFPLSERGVMRDASPIACASAHHPLVTHHLSAHHPASPASSPEPTAVELARAVLRLPSAPPTLPGRAERPCLACGRQCREGILFDTAPCFEMWKVSRRALRAARGGAA